MLGLANAIRGDYVNGLAFSRRAQAKAIELNNLSSLAAADISIAFLLLMVNDPQHSLDEIRGAIEAAQQAGDHVYNFVGNGFQAWAQSRLGAHEAARASLSVAHQVLDRFGGRLSLVELVAAAEAEVALNAGNYQLAATLAEKAISFAQAQNSMLAELTATIVLAQAWFVLQPTWEKEVDRLLETGVSLAEIGDAKLIIANTYTIWATMDLQRGKPNQAHAHLKLAENLYESGGVAEQLAKVRQRLADLG
jgi:hypothetical protein